MSTAAGVGRAAVLMAVTFLACAAWSCAAVAESAFDRERALELSQAAIGRTLEDRELTTSDGRSLRIAQLRGRPLVLSLIYTSCYHVCPTLTTHLHDAVTIARAALGRNDFSVLSVGFDTVNDTPQRMAVFARERRIADPQWYFASADAQTIEELAGNVGFAYFASPKGFDHLAQTTIIDADGRVVVQVYGADFAVPLLVEPLKRLAIGEAVARSSVDGWLDRARLFCTIYDPASGRYTFDYSLFVNIGAGLAALAMIAIAIVRAARNVT
jgi:protein SCO1